MRGEDFLQIVGMAALWGASYLFLRMAAPEFGAVPLIAIRLWLAAAILVPFLVRIADWRHQIRSHALPLALLGIGNAAVPFTLFAYATLYLTAGFTAILNSTAPLFGTLVAWIWLRDRPRAGAIAGLATGVAGVVVLVGGVPEPVPGTGLAIVASLVASFCYGLSASLVKRWLQGVNPLVTTFASFAFAAIALTPLAVFDLPTASPSPRAWLAMLLLAALCTGVPNILYFGLIARAGPARAISVAFLIPAFGVLWGALVLAERVTWRMAAGGLTILVGTALVAGVLRLPAGKSATAAPNGGGSRDDP